MRKDTGPANHNAKPPEYYETTPVLRSNFKKICATQGWNFDDFIEYGSSEWYISPDYTYSKRKYFYVLKKGKMPRRIGRERLILLGSTVYLLDSIIHDKYKEDDKYTDECLVWDDAVLTDEIKLLKESIKRFEEKTSIKLKVKIITED